MNRRKIKKVLDLFKHCCYNKKAGFRNKFSETIKYAGVAELADALDLGSSVPDVQVQLLSPA